MSHVTDKLSLYIDRGLPEAERAAVDAHLAGCAECRQALTGLMAAASAVAGLPEKDLPPGYFERLEDKRLAAVRRERTRRLTLALAGLALAALTAGLAFKHFLPGLFSSVSGMISGAAGSLGK